MPIYEYECTRGHRFEVRHAVGETVERCEQCGAPVRRIFSPVGIIFKGPGFHVTDYRKTPVPAEGGDGKKPAAQGSSDASKAGPDGGKDSSTTASAPTGTKSE